MRTTVSCVQQLNADMTESNSVFWTSYRSQTKYAPANYNISLRALDLRITVQRYGLHVRAIHYIGHHCNLVLFHDNSMWPTASSWISATSADHHQDPEKQLVCKDDMLFLSCAFLCPANKLSLWVLAVFSQTESLKLLYIAVKLYSTMRSLSAIRSIQSYFESIG